jgi:hypothetical protein
MGLPADPAHGTGLPDRMGAAGGILGLVSTGGSTAVQSSVPVRPPPAE